jgi:hypothetical protein
MHLTGQYWASRGKRGIGNWDVVFGGGVQGRAAPYSYRGRVEMGTATYPDNSGKASLGKPVRNVVRAHQLTRAWIGQEPEKRQKDHTPILIRDVRAEHQDAWASTVELYDLATTQEQQAWKRHRNFIT